ncbi:MAG: endonuclease III [Bacteroidota bacterium]
MELFNNWKHDLKPLLDKYEGKKHPLEYKNRYQLLIMVILSAQDSDANINKIAPVLFQTYPNLKSLASSSTNDLIPHLLSIRNFTTKANWIIEIVQLLKNDDNIPFSMNNLVALKGIGRKSANVIMRESKTPAEGIIADLHVIRVAPRIGIIPEYKDGNKVEKLLMEVLPKDIWGEIGMSLSFLGREICRPTNPKCTICPINNTCNYYKTKL